MKAILECCLLDKAPKSAHPPHMLSCLPPKAIIADIRRRYGDAVLIEDISGGTEPVPIPLINEVRASHAHGCGTFMRVPYQALRE